MKLMRLAAILLAPLFLASCLLSPGKFTSSLDIRKDRTFTFTYQGEVLLLDPSQGLQEGIGKSLGAAGQSDDGDAKSGAGSGDDKQNSMLVTVHGPDGKERNPSEQMATQRKAVLEALSKEEGYRSVEYLGENKFRVDYSVTGKLDRNFVYPLNLDAMAIIPWIAIELRKDGTARMMAIGFGDSSNNMNGASAAKPDMGSAGREGTFTFTTDATLVMQNNEAGMAAGPGTKVVWKITPTTKSVPTAVVRF